MTEKFSNNTDPRFAQLEENIKILRERAGEAAVRSGRRPEDVTILAVTKTVDVPLINHAIACGMDHIGENRVQEFLGKRDGLHLDGVEAHLIGQLQTNKVRKIVGLVSMIQSVDSVKLAKEIGRISAEQGIVTECLAEVNIGGEASKSGVSPDELPELLGQMGQIEGIRVRGLMTVPPICDTKAEIRQYFSNMRQLFIDIQHKKIDNIYMDCLSMGMSSDYEEAILEGATLIRPGTALFGARIYR